MLNLFLPCLYFNPPSPKFSPPDKPGPFLFYFLNSSPEKRGYRNVALTFRYNDERGEILP
jgi:hypothetical protein